MVFIIISILLLIHLAWWVWADRRMGHLPRSNYWRLGVALFMGALLAYLGWMIFNPSAARRAHIWIPTFLTSIAYVWYLLMLPVVTLLLIGLALTWLGRQGHQLLWRRNAASDRSTEDAAQPSSDTDDIPPSTAPTRRQVLLAGIAAAPMVMTLGLSGVGMRQVRHFRVRPMEISIAGLPHSLDGMTIAHVSDVHVGKFTKGEMLDAIANATNALEADLVVLTGDLIDLSLDDLPEAMEMVQKLHGRYGVVMCEGNHDLIEDGLAFRQFVQRIDPRLLLLDQTREMQIRGYPLQMLGVTWRRRDEDQVDPMARVIAQRDPEAFPILLAHHPHVFDHAIEAGMPLTLAGHTHGGQLQLTDRIGAGNLLFRYVSGLYQRNGSSLVVSNGVGNWMPVRANAPAEIIHLQLRRA